jgi:transposase-like protein
MSVSCPLCGSENVTIKRAVDHYPIPFCEELELTHPVYYCQDCEEEGDFDGTLDAQVKNDLQKANAASAVRLLDNLSRNGVSMTYLEKALRLPYRTTQRWKRGNISQAALALLRLIRFDPHLLEVADENFSEEAVCKFYLAGPYHLIYKHFGNADVQVTTGEAKTSIRYSGYLTHILQPSIESEKVVVTNQRVAIP